MMNHLTGIEIARDNMVSVHIFMLFAQRSLDGGTRPFAERWWGTKTFSMFKVGYQIFSNCLK